MSISQILVALLTTAGIVESRERERDLESWLSSLDKERARESGCGRLGGGSGTGECLNTREPKNQMSVASEIRIRVCDFVVMLTSHICVTHQALVTKPSAGSTRLYLLGENLDQRPTAKNNFIHDRNSSRCISS